MAAEKVVPLPAERRRDSAFMPKMRDEHGIDKESFIGALLHQMLPRASHEQLQILEYIATNTLQGQTLREKPALADITILKTLTKENVKAACKSRDNG
jgi:uncharacterized protein YaaR (DUF327 family)